MNVQKKKIEDLHPAEYNPRKALQPGDPEFEKIVRSLETFGYVDPIIINKDGTIIGGHQRCSALKYLGYDEVDVVVIDVDKNKEKALNVALNKISGEWDEEKLANLLIDIDTEGFDASLTGFDETEIEDIIGSVTVAAEANDDNFDEEKALEKIEEPEAQRGDVWKLGNHKLMCGDSTDINDVQNLIGGEMMDLIITDPPYNVDYEGKVSFLNQANIKTSREMNHIENDCMDNDSFYSFLYDAFSNMCEICRDGAAFYIFHSDTETVNFRTAMVNAGFKIAECLIWEKNSFVLGRQDYQWRHEPVLYGWKTGAGHYFIKDRCQDTVIVQEDVDFESMKKAELVAWIENLFKEYENQTTVHLEKKPRKSDMHPTMKPIELIGKFMNNSSKPGWNVADLFGGSGSTLMAAEQLGRSAFIMEYEPKYCDVIIQRWEEFTGEKAVKISG